MARPALKIWVPLAVVVLAGLAWPALCGLGAQSRLRESELSLDRALGPWLGARVKSYRRGWLGSQAGLELVAVTSEKRRTLALPVQIFHGPLPVAAIARGEAPLRLVEAALSAAVGTEALLGSPGTGGGKGRADRFRLGGTFEIGGSSHFRMSFPVIPASYSGLSCQGGVLLLDFTERPGQVRAEVDLGGLSLVTDRGKRALALGELRGQLEAEQGPGKARAELDLGSLALAGRGMRVAFRQVRAGRWLERGQQGLLLGRGSATVGAAAIRSDAPGWNWKLSGLTFGDEAGVKQGNFIYRARLGIKRWQAGAESWGPLDITLTLSRLQARALARAAARLNRARQAYDPTDGESREKWEAEIRQALAALAPSAPRLELTARLRQDRQQALADLRMAVDPARVRSADSLKRVAEVTRWVATLHVPAALFEQLLQQGVESYAAMAKPPGITSEEQKQALFQNTLRGLQENNLLTRDEKGYHGRLEWTGSLTLLNGQPPSPWLMLRLMVIASALQGHWASGGSPVRMYLKAP